MFNFISDLFARITGKPNVVGAAKVSSKPVIHTDVYLGSGGWFFTWHDEKHENGEMFGPFGDKGSATFMRGVFVAKRENQGYLVIQEGR